MTRTASKKMRNKQMTRKFQIRIAATVEVAIAPRDVTETSVYLDPIMMLIRSKVMMMM